MHHGEADLYMVLYVYMFAPDLHSNNLRTASAVYTWLIACLA